MGVNPALGETYSRHNLPLDEVMKALGKANLTLNPKKCSFGSTKIAF